VISGQGENDNGSGQQRRRKQTERTTENNGRGRAKRIRVRVSDVPSTAFVPPTVPTVWPCTRQRGKNSSRGNRRCRRELLERRYRASCNQISHGVLFFTDRTCFNDELSGCPLATTSGNRYRLENANVLFFFRRAVKHVVVDRTHVISRTCVACVSLTGKFCSRRSVTVTGDRCNAITRTRTGSSTLG